MIENIHDQAGEKLDPKIKEVKNMLELKVSGTPPSVVKKYCQDDSPESAFEVYLQKDESSESERCYNVQLG